MQKNKRILVTGANGQLGSEFRNLVGSEREFVFTDVKELDITDAVKVAEFCDENQIGVIVNCAAYTAVDKAEVDYATADAVNHLAVRNLAEAARNLNIRLVHVSTDYVFDGTCCRPYVEDDKANPQTVYGETKLAGEKAIQEIAPNGAVIIRTSWVYSQYGNNFVKTMLRLGAERESLNVIFDQIGTPTYARDLASLILKVVAEPAKDGVEVYHFSNEGVTSWYDFAVEIIEFAGLACKVLPIGTKDYPTPAARPHYSVMNKGKVKRAFDMEIPHWKTSLVNCLKKL